MRTQSLVVTESTSRVTELMLLQQAQRRAIGDQPLITKMSVEQASTVVTLTNQVNRAVFGLQGVQLYGAVGNL